MELSLCTIKPLEVKAYNYCDKGQINDQMNLLIKPLPHSSVNSNFFLKFTTALVDLLSIGFPGIHPSYEMQVHLGYTSNTCINLHLYYDDEKQVLFNGDFAREKTLLARGFEPTTF